MPLDIQHFVAATVVVRVGGAEKQLAHHAAASTVRITYGDEPPEFEGLGV